MKRKLASVSLFALAIVLSSLPLYAGVGAVYSETNGSGGNAVMVYSRTTDGRLYSASIGAIPTGGNGTGSALGSQGALATDESNRFLFAVNAGSNNISAFRITEASLSLIGVTSSNGMLNAGGSVGGIDTVAGFSVDDSGHLTPIVSGLQLSAASVAPEEIGFNPDGNLLIVTEKATNNIDVFTVDRNGVASGPNVVASAAPNPYGFAFGKRNQLFVSDAEGGAGGAGAMSSYAASVSGDLQTITAAAPDNQTAPCWVALTADGLYAYTTNTGSGTISSYTVGFDGTLGLLNSVAGNAGSGSSPFLTRPSAITRATCMC